MSKPLELAVFEKEPGLYGREPRYHSPDGFWAYPESHVDGYAADKRLTDAELAAEYWAAREASNWSELMMTEWAADRHSNRASKMCDSWFRKKRRSDYEGHLLHRFATLPHYDEATT